MRSMPIPWKDWFWKFWEETILRFQRIIHKIWKTYSQTCSLKTQQDDQACEKSWRKSFWAREYQSFWRPRLPKMNSHQLSLIDIWLLETIGRKTRSNVTMSQQKVSLKKATRSRQASQNLQLSRLRTNKRRLGFRLEIPKVNQGLRWHRIRGSKG